MNANVIYDSRESIDSAPAVKKAVCAVSGGMDSASCLFHAVKLYGNKNVVAVSMYYGQRHDIELKKAIQECAKLDVSHIELDLTPVFNFNKSLSALMKDSGKEIQEKSYQDIMHEKIASNEAPISDEYVPNRNSLFINVLCAIGLQKFNNEPFAVVVGVHSDDDLKSEGSNVSAYPDCSVEFVEATNKALQYATAGLCYVYAPLAKKTKAQVAEFGVVNGMTVDDFNATWSCYKGDINNGKQCGVCPTCRDRIKALVKSGVYTRVEDIVQNYNLSEEQSKRYFNCGVWT